MILLDYRTLLGATLIAVSVCGSDARSEGVAEVWEGQPYRIEASLAIDAPGDLAGQLAENLPEYLRQRANASIGSVWRLNLEPAEESLRHEMINGLDQLTDKELPEAKDGEDKRLLLAVRATPWGYELSAREFDRYLQRWGPPIRRTVRQLDAVPEQLFALVEQAVAPVAHFQPAGSNPQQVAIELRGADLPATGAGDFRQLQPGDVLQPALVRKTRDGNVAADGVTAIPWTYIEVIEPAEGSKQLVGRIRSASIRPLGVRRGRVEQVAIAMRHDRQPSTLELTSRAAEYKPLSGYEVFAQNGDEKELKLVGKSDAAGEVQVEPGKTAVQMLYLKSDGVTLARLPVVPGAKARVTVQLPDDEMRLRAAARLAAVREDIVDVVARRTIFMSRVRQQIGEKSFEAAHELLSSLDELPGTTQFRVALDRDAQVMRAEDPQVQRRIDKLFRETKNALGKFLNPQPIGALHEELRQAELQSKDATGGGES